MRVFRIFGIGLSGLSGNPFRTALAALGVVIGVAAVVTLTSLGNGIQKSVSGQISDLGPNLITVSPDSGGGGDPFSAAASSTLTREDTENVAGIPSVGAVSSNVSTSASVEGENLSLSGVDPSYESIRDPDLSSGRFVENEGEIVLANSTAKKLFDAPPADAVGRKLEISGVGSEEAGSGGATEATEATKATGSSQARGAGADDSGASGANGGDASDIPEGAKQALANAQRENKRQAGAQSEPQAEPQAKPQKKEYEVVGIVETENASFGPPSSGGGSGGTSYISTAGALDLAGTDNVGQIIASATSADSVGQAKKNITSTLKEDHGGAKDFSVITQEELLSAFTQITDQLNIFLAGIAGISLLVGGIGIMNIMLVSVAERTREIGVRKALGATDSDVLLQFLFEAVLLAALGGLVGVGVGVAASEILPRVLADLPEASFGVSQIALAFGISAVIGVLFGSLPAYRSARLAPVEALRRE